MEEKQQLIIVFKEFDKNGDGVLSREEILEGYKRFMNDADAEAEVNRIMEQVDIDKSGFIDYTEFVAASVDRKKLTSKEKLETAFKLFDKDSSGSISASEIKEVFGSAFANVDEQVWLEIIKEVDVNGDGEISFEEFSNMILKYIATP
jgi:calcium-dependent protein kinase